MPVTPAALVVEALIDDRQAGVGDPADDLDPA
jgi:hypothetical protein